MDIRKEMKSESKTSFRERRRKKGVSPILATVILLGITVAAGGAVYAIWTGQSTQISASNLIQIDTVNAVKGSNHADFTVTVKNIGTSPWKELEVWIGQEAGSRPILYEELHEISRGDANADLDNPLRAEALAVLSDGTPAALGRKFVMAIDDKYPKSREVTAYPSAQVANLQTLDGKWGGPTVNCTSDANAVLDGTQCTVFTGKKLKEPVAPGQTMRFYADILLPNQLRTTEDTPQEILGVVGTGNNPAGNPITTLNVGDELVVNVKAITMDGQEVQMQSVVRLIGV